jgi:LacI family transcriptional regulator
MRRQRDFCGRRKAGTISTGIRSGPIALRQKHRVRRSSASQDRTQYRGIDLQAGVTITDVAQRAGVSAMTVSRVINRSGYASPATRTKVEAAVAELGYVPNAVARHLRSKRTKTIALVMSDITNPFFTTIARGVEDAATPRGYAVMFANTDEKEHAEIEYLRMLVQRQIDGVLLVPAGNSAEPFRLLRAQKVPAVVIDRRVSVRKVDEVRCDSEAGAYELVRHLIGLGHSRIAVITGRRNISTSTDRVVGYERALREAGIPVEPKLVTYDSFSLEGGYRQVKQILEREPRPTAIFATNNFLAFGALRALRETSVRIPADISLVTFDDLPAEWHDDPFITVLAQPAYELGRRATELLLGRLQGTLPAKRQVIVLPGELIVRRSSGPARAAHALALGAAGGPSTSLP